MKINRFAALAAIAVLVVAGMATVSARVFAQPIQRIVTQAQGTEAPDTQEAAGTNGNSADQQVGDQTGQDTGAQPEATEPTGTEPAAASQQAPQYTGSITVTETLSNTQTEADESAALASQTKITLDQAKAAALAANSGATVVKAGLDNENGQLVYSVELSTGADVKVDAGNGTILHTDSGGDNQN